MTKTQAVIQIIIADRARPSRAILHRVAKALSILEIDGEDQRSIMQMLSLDFLIERSK